VAFGRRPPVPHLLLAGASLALVAGDVTYQVQVLRSGHTVFSAGSLPELWWLLWGLAVAAAALHPAAFRRLRTEDPTGPRGEATVSRRRLLVFGVLALLVPAVPALVPDAPPRALIPAALGAAVALLLVVRLGMLAHLVGRKTADLAYARAQREALRDELKHRARHDPLTGLASRSALLSQLGTATDATVLMLLNLDGFAEINDAYGHGVGDELLIEAADRLRTALAGAYLLARTGADEFAALHPATGADNAARRAVAALRPVYRLGGRHLRVTASAGLVPVVTPSALRDADLALSAAKEAGRDRVVRFRPELRDRLVRRSELAAGLHGALARRELELVYQPVIDLTNGRMRAAEALLRWTRADGEVISPAQFIPVAEQTGLILPIGWWALAEACRQALPWWDRYGVAVTVNLSAHQLREPDLTERVRSALAAAGLPGAALILELTESVLITGGRSALADLRAAGVQIALDDFGTGYSSLSYLTTLPVDILKLDRAFTAARPGEREYLVTVAVLELAARLGLTTIAEGVETRAQAQTLRSLGCPLAQGFLYSPGARPDVLDQLLDRWNPPVDLRAAT
jgi:diguanylate cyclase (GGDEF)-like protein